MALDTQVILISLNETQDIKNIALTTKLTADFKNTIFDISQPLLMGSGVFSAKIRC